ncbi:MAG TPA: DUF4153 domain-containing protein [Fibrobacteria bacterium]|nr:DUF4153 domain-containing protein [Fibrobacteria bacterium]
MKPIAMNMALRQALRALGRFPLVYASAVIGTVAALWLNHLPPSEAEARTVAGNLLMTSWLGVGLFFSLAILSESRRWALWGAAVVQALGVAALYGYHQGLASTAYPVRLSRFWLCMLAAHLCAALASAMARGATVDSFWRFNQKLAARLGLSLGYLSLIYIGLSVALASIKGLFELEIPDGWFLDSGIFALGIFNTWFFLAGVPGGRAAFAPPASASPGAAGDAFADTVKEFVYPRQLRVLTLLILMPLVCVYLFIVYAYAVRTLMIWRWPTGWVTYLLLSFCALGLLCLFLVQPLAERGNNRWAKAYSRHFHLALFPVLILLFAAIGKRVQEYGITENRYFVLALGVWLTGIVLHSALDAPRDLRILPASLCLVALLASFGPWGAFEVSRKSQVQRLKSMLESQGMLVGGKLAKAPGRIPRRVAREIGGIADYLEERERLSDLKPWIPDMDDSGQTHSVAWHKALDGKFALLEALELPYMPPEATGPGRAETVAFSCLTLSSSLRKVSGFDFLYADFQARPDPEGSPPMEEGFRFAFDTASGEIRFYARDTLGPVVDVGAHFQSLRDRYPDAYNLNLPEGEMTLAGEDNALKVLVKLRTLNGEADPEGVRLKGFSADVFIEVRGRSRSWAKAPIVARAQSGKPAFAPKPVPRPAGKPP